MASVNEPLSSTLYLLGKGTKTERDSTLRITATTVTIVKTFQYSCDDCKNCIVGTASCGTADVCIFKKGGLIILV